ncbi:hypothetical protein BJY01DRAFT_231197 [Aspergillus pseudoustus]|uniref:Nucleoside phosphorylase domain-containing protein n=1 Tax=Aspergillus pseudoustus TaxID=1810923 RepID=A0ABR4KY52_9EURO
MSKAEKQHADYTVASIYTLPLKAAAARTMLDETHPNRRATRTVYGTVSAAVVVSQLLSTFTRIEFGLLLGIGGGIPKTVNNDMWLGDIIVSKPTSDGTSGVIAYDSGKRTTGDGDLQLSAVLNRPPQLLLNAVSQLQA